MEEIVAITTFKITSLASGYGLSYMGYRLFMSGIWGDAGSAEGAFGDNTLIIKKAAPGTFFAILGATIIVSTIWKGMEFETRAQAASPIQNIPKISQELLDEKPNLDF